MRRKTLMRRCRPLIDPLFLRVSSIRDIFLSNQRLFSLLIQDYEMLFDDAREFTNFLREIQNDAINEETEKKLSIFNE